MGVCGVAPKLVLHHKSLVSSAPGHHKPLTHPFHPLPRHQNTESARFAPHSGTQRPQNSPSRPDSRRISGSRSAGGSVSTPPPARPPRIYQNRSETGRSKYLAAPPASPRHAPDVIIQYPLTIQWTPTCAIQHRPIRVMGWAYRPRPCHTRMRDGGWCVSCFALRYG